MLSLSYYFNFSPSVISLCRYVYHCWRDVSQAVSLCFRTANSCQRTPKLATAFVLVCIQRQVEFSLTRVCRIFFLYTRRFVVCTNQIYRSCCLPVCVEYVYGGFLEEILQDIWQYAAVGHSQSCFYAYSLFSFLIYLLINIEIYVK